MNRKARILVMSNLLSLLALLLGCGGGGSGSGGTITQPSVGAILITSNVAGATVNIDDSNTGIMPQSKSLTINNIAVGNHTVKLSISGYQDATKTVNVNSGKTTSVHFDLSVFNHAPTADAGADQRGFSGFTYTFEWNGTRNVFTAHAVTFSLDGSNSNDPDGDALTYEWAQTIGPSVTLSSPAASTTNFIPTESGTYSFRLAVSDGMTSDTDTVDVIVEKASGKLVFSGNLDQMRPGFSCFRRKPCGKSGGFT